MSDPDLAKDDGFQHWISRLRSGDSDAQSELFSQNFSKIAQYAERRLTPSTRRLETGEDVAISAIKSVINGLKGNQFLQLESDQSLMKLLYVITARKATRYNQRQHAQRRGGGQVRGESVFMQGRGEKVNIAEAVAASESTEQQFDADIEDLLAKLDDESLRQVALMKLQGLDNVQIADAMGCVERTIRRKLQLIYEMWQDDQADA